MVYQGEATDRESKELNILKEGAIVGLERTHKNSEAPTRILKKDSTRGAQLGLQTIVQRVPKVVFLTLRTRLNWVLKFRM